MATHNYNDLIHEAELRIASLIEGLPKEVHAGSISVKAKIPYKIILYREALIWRMAETSSAALSLFKEKKNVSAILLARSAVESAAACWFIMETIEEYKIKRSQEWLDKRAIRLLVGQKWSKEYPAAIHINDMLRSADAKVPGIEKSYHAMSEYAHPNWAGVFGMYGKRGREDFITYFGPSTKGNEEVEQVGLNGFLGPMTMFEYSYNKISDLMPVFVRQCEDDLSKEVF